MPRFDLPSGYTWLIRFRKRCQFDTQTWETGPASTFALRIPILGRILRIERSLTRWL